MRLILVLLATFFGASAFAQTAPSQPPLVTAFVAVNVVPMDSKRVLSRQTVLVENGKITAIGTSLPLPKNAQVIDGHGSAFLSPGLADMHTHSDTRADLLVYLANGVTTVLNMGGASSDFMDHARLASNSGKIPGPHVYASFRVDGSAQYGQFIVTTADEARWIVRLAKTNGYDFIKVYNNLSPECFQALVDEGRAQHIAIVGHGVTQVGLERQLAAGQVLVAHAEEFLYTTFAHPNDNNDSVPNPDQIPAAIAFIKRYRAFVTADLNTYSTIARQWGKPDVVEGFLQMPETRYLSPDQRIEWRAEDYVRRKGDLSAKLNFLKRFTKDMSDAGVALVAGTDAPSIPGLVPGFSLHDDLAALEQAGLDRYHALAAATRTPGELIHRSIPAAEPFGTVTLGNRADLILSEKNPLEDLSTLRKPLGVMANGKWYARNDLHALLDQVAAKYDSAFLHK
ncbi:amidohydrolase [Pseudolysobacter antarcticus]|uniref:Amidohydrolase n=1 Tax=Pseudolysobacter antarcticus TaxID=2511995 RepID=A0A411HMQ4_9GAMM|nr:amidohydrolase [Pseudolysobacter antarcticus]QBB71750.1 amidohydrolase [Pseudolysobacter antarcticus]